MIVTLGTALIFQLRPFPLCLLRRLFSRLVGPIFPRLTVCTPPLSLFPYQGYKLNYIMVLNLSNVVFFSYFPESPHDLFSKKNKLHWSKSYHVICVHNIRGGEGRGLCWDECQRGWWTVGPAVFVWSSKQMGKTRRWVCCTWDLYQIPCPLICLLRGKSKYFKWKECIKVFRGGDMAKRGTVVSTPTAWKGKFFLPFE